MADVGHRTQLPGPPFCEFCEQPCEGDLYIVGLDGRAAHHVCLTKWRDNNPVPEEDA